MTTGTKYLLLLFALFSSNISAQETLNNTKKIDSIVLHKFNPTHKWEGGLLLGITAYDGDLKFAFSETRLIGGVFVRRAIGNYFGINISLAQGILRGSDSHSTSTPWRVARNFAFKSPLTEIAIRGEYHFLGITRKVLSLSSGASVMDEVSQQNFRVRIRKVSPFIYVGSGLAITKPKTNFNDKLLPNPVTAGFRIDADKSASTAKAHVIVPFGGGLRIPFVNKQTILTLEGGFRPTFSDEIDGVSVAGNPNVNDWYFVGTVGLSKTLGYSKDSDKDGIPDKYDLCPFLKGDEKLQGCPDRDGDGVTDDKDVCPTIAGLAIYEGCPDTDGDGIIDKYDDCPNEVGIGKFKGCPTEEKSLSVFKDSTKNTRLTTLDTIKINVESSTQPIKPVEITQSAAQKDLLTLNETKKLLIPIIPKVDTLIVNQTTPPQYVQEKPTTEPTELPVTVVDIPITRVEKPIQMVTLPRDTPQYIPEKPVTKPIVIIKPISSSDTTLKNAENPISVEQPQKTINSNPEGEDVRDSLNNAFNIVRNHYTISPIYFATNKAIYKVEAFVILDEIAAILLANPKAKLYIKGHTDNRGKASSNLILSINRAKMSYMYLLKKRVPSKQMYYKGFGQQKPAADNDTEEARQLNRRVEFEIID